MKIYIGADHRGFELKEQLKQHLKNYEITDCGAREYEEDDDYTDYAVKVAESVTQNENSRGIVLCGSGVGVDITSNKIPGIRCGFAKNNTQITEARQADNINVLAIAADFTDLNEAKEAVDVFLNTEFTPEERYTRRIDKIKKVEKK